jgi:hypothetical protein
VLEPDLRTVIAGIVDFVARSGGRLPEEIVVDEFLQRLRERKLVQWALAYVAGAFALLQAFDIVGQQFGWPETVRRASRSLAIGFFITIVLAWYHGSAARNAAGTDSAGRRCSASAVRCSGVSRRCRRAGRTSPPHRSARIRLRCCRS